MQTEAITMKHYCGCDGDERCDGGEWCCGGDAECSAVESEPECVDGLNHKWTREGCGGCDDNPGVWSLGGTAWRFVSRCRYCGIERTVVDPGTERNPGECDSVTYSPGHPDHGAARAELRRLRRNRLARERRARARQTS